MIAKDEFEQGLIIFLTLVGKARPGDLEDNFTGKPDLFSQITSPLQGWLLSPYPDALTALIDRGLVRWRKGDDGTIWYSLAEPVAEAVAEPMRK